MDIAALIAWILTALGGFVMLSIWISRGGLRREAGASAGFPPPVVFGHLGVAATGLILWIAYLVTGNRALAWTAFVLLLAVAALGAVMLTRWLPLQRAGATRAAASPDAGTAGAAETASDATAAPDAAGAAVPPESHIPPMIVAGHGLLAAVTLVLVLLATVMGAS
ncbi:hypothetical protein [Bailinhaonella thermotolerans]|uniref:Uncharacterized protein n=1 Tax=Bailinhaonella thermotolerans TaxID=1070861 RepID=A0A3A4B578_9ACTN|nr:hypothetical protein [Bailinhaonella thermotolerans]RJL33231.1 hypothetical protein D5H75_10360 [Bailinhaonella thermotolerans]